MLSWGRLLSWWRAGLSSGHYCQFWHKNDPIECKRPMIGMPSMENKVAQSHFYQHNCLQFSWPWPLSYLPRSFSQEFCFHTISMKTCDILFLTPSCLYPLLHLFIDSFTSYREFPIQRPKTSSDKDLLKKFSIGTILIYVWHPSYTTYICEYIHSFPNLMGIFCVDFSGFNQECHPFFLKGTTI